MNSRSKPGKTETEDMAGEPGINQRLAEIYGQDKLQMQTMYEKQVVRDTWLLKDEAIWLISGIDPGHSGEMDQQTLGNLSGLWEHAQKCVEEGLLEVVNREQEAIKWEVRPIDIYQWARISRVPMPEVFLNLMDYVAKSINSSNSAIAEKNTQDDHNAESREFDQDREAVLGMALATIVAWPDQCKSSSGRIKVDKIVNIIVDKEKFWMGDRKTGMSSTAMRDLISKWLATVPQ